MSRRREQRLRRKARAELRAMQRDLDAASSWRPIALAAIAYVDEINAPNPHEPWSIANRRDELRDIVHAFQGRPERTRRDHQVIRPAAPVPQPAPVAVIRPVAPLRTIPASEPSTARIEARRELALRNVELKRRELRHAAQKYGAEANKFVRDAARVAELAVELDLAACALVSAERQLADADRAVAARRSA